MNHFYQTYEPYAFFNRVGQIMVTMEDGRVMPFADETHAGDGACWWAESRSEFDRVRNYLNDNPTEKFYL